VASESDGGKWADNSSAWATDPAVAEAVGYKKKHTWSFFLELEEFKALFKCVY
jgi:hypothetical protein